MGDGSALYTFMFFYCKFSCKFHHIIENDLWFSEFVPISESHNVKSIANNLHRIDTEENNSTKTRFVLNTHRF